MRVIRAMLIVVFFALFTKLGGFLVTGVLVGRLYGAGEATDAFFAAYQSVVFLLFSIAVKGIMPALTPLFIEEMQQRGEQSAWRFASGVANMTIIVAIVVAGACIAFAPEIMRLLVPGFFAPGREAGQISVTMVRIMSPGLLALCLSVVTYSLLNSYKIFSVPSAAEAVQKFVWAAVLFGIIVLASRGATAIAVGFLIGVIAQIAVNLFGLRRSLSHYRPTLGGVSAPRLVTEGVVLAAFVLGTGALWWLCGRMNAGEGWRLGILMGAVALYLLALWWRAKESRGLMGRFVALMVPLLLGILIAKYRDLATNYFTSFTQSGIFSDKQFAERVGNLPTVIWAYALAIAMFPYLCEMASRKDLASFGGLITRAMRMIALFFVPFSLIMVILGQPIIQLVYDNGSWPAEHVRYAGLALSVFSAAMFFYAVENVVMQSFFSIQRMWMPTAVGIVASLGQIAFLYVGIVALGYNDPAQIFWFVIIAFPMSRTVKNVLLLFVLRWHVPILPAKETLRYGAQLLGVSAAVVAVTLVSYIPIARFLDASRYKAEDIVVDTFNPGETNAIGEDTGPRSSAETGVLTAPGWRGVRGEGPRVEDVSGGEGQAEYALRAEGAGFCVERDVSKFDLRKAAALSLKVKAERDAALRIALIGTDGRSDYEINVKRSDRRAKYDVKLDAEALSRVGPIQRLALGDVSATGATDPLWLDTLVFRPAFPMGQRIRFELFKLIQAAVPMGLGILALVVAAVALRIEEIGIIFKWVKEEGLSRIKEKMKGGKGGTGKAAETKPSAVVPDVES